MQEYNGMLGDGLIRGTIFYKYSLAVACPQGVGVWGCPPLLPKDSARDSFKIEEKMAGYRFGKNLGRMRLRN